MSDLWTVTYTLSESNGHRTTFIAYLYCDLEMIAPTIHDHYYMKMPMNNFSIEVYATNKVTADKLMEPVAVDHKVITL